MNIAVIPARGGSKRIYQKNITNFLGKPIIYWSIKAAKRSNIFDRIIVSTDNNDIAKIAQKFGAEVPFLRPDEISGDHATTFDVIKHAINWITKKENINIDTICCIYAAAPLIQDSDLIKGYEKLITSKKSFVFPIAKFSYPIQRAFKLNTDNEVTALFPENMKSRSQDLALTFHDAGQFYWGRPDAFLEDHDLFSSDSSGLILPSYRVCDIDEPDDLIRAEILFKSMNEIDDLKK